MIRHYHQHKVQKFLKTLTHIVFNIKLICCWEPTPIYSIPRLRIGSIRKIHSEGKKGVVFPKNRCTEYIFSVSSPWGRRKNCKIYS